MKALELANSILEKYKNNEINDDSEIWMEYPDDIDEVLKLRVDEENDIVLYCKD